MKKAIYPGSFDPITNGHLDIIKRALQIFDVVYISVLNNPDKEGLFSVPERIALIRDVMADCPQVQVESFSGLLVDYAKEKDVYTVIRGLRAVVDFDYEFQMAVTNRTLLKQLDTIFLMTEGHNAFLSASVVRQVARFGGDVSSFVPQVVQRALKEKYFV